MKSHLKSNKKIVKSNFKAIKKREGTLIFDKIILFLGNDCNLNCIGCYSRDDPKSTEEKLSFIPEIKSVLDYSKENGISGLIICGKGEPLMDSEFWDVIKYSSQNLELKTTVYTNGTLVDDEISKKLFDYDVDIIVKLLSLNDKIHDDLTNTKGSNELTFKGISSLSNAGFKEPRLAIESPILKSNFSGIPDLLRYCRKNKFLPYFESLLDTNPNDKYCLKRERISNIEITNLFNELQRVDKKEFRIITRLYEGQRVYCSPFYSDQYETPVVNLNRKNYCSRTFSTFSVINNGDVRFCIVDYKTVGNIKKNSLDEILSVSNPRVIDLFEKPCEYSTANYLINSLEGSK